MHIHIDVLRAHRLCPVAFIIIIIIMLVVVIILWFHIYGQRKERERKEGKKYRWFPRIVMHDMLKLKVNSFSADVFFPVFFFFILCFVFSGCVRCIQEVSKIKSSCVMNDRTTFINNNNKMHARRMECIYTHSAAHR